MRLDLIDDDVGFLYLTCIQVASQKLFGIVEILRWAWLDRRNVKWVRMRLGRNDIFIDHIASLIWSLEDRIIHFVLLKVSCVLVHRMTLQGFACVSNGRNNLLNFLLFKIMIDDDIYWWLLKMAKMRTWLGLSSWLWYLIAIDWVNFVQDVDLWFIGWVLRDDWALLDLAFQVFVADAFGMRLEHGGFAWLEDWVNLHETLIEGLLRRLLNVFVWLSPDVAIDVISNLSWRLRVDVYGRLGLRAVVVCFMTICLDVRWGMEIVMLVGGKIRVSIGGKDIGFSVLQPSVWRVVHRQEIHL